MRANHADQHRISGLSLIELLLAVAMSATVMVASFALVSAYGHASSEIYDHRPLRSEAVNVHAYIQNWLQRTCDIIAVTPPGDQLTITQAGVAETGVTRIFAYMGDRPGRAYDDLVAKDEIEALVWTYNWDVANGQSADSTALSDLLNSWGACSGCPSDLSGDGVVDNDDLTLLLITSGASDPAFVGSLKHYYHSSEDATIVADSDLNHDDLVANWLTGGPDVEVWSNNVNRFAAEVLPGAARSPAVDVKMTMMTFPQIRLDSNEPGGVYVPPNLSLQVTGTPYTYVKAVGN